MLNPAFDMEARNFVGQQYKQAGINMALNTTPTKIEKGSDGKLTVTAEPKDGEPYTVSGFDIVMMATGRAPTTKGLGLEDVRPVPCSLASASAAAAAAAAAAALLASHGCWPTSRVMLVQDVCLKLIPGPVSPLMATC